MIKYIIRIYTKNDWECSDRIFLIKNVYTRRYENYSVVTRTVLLCVNIYRKKTAFILVTKKIISKDSTRLGLFFRYSLAKGQISDMYQ